MSNPFAAPWYPVFSWKSQYPEVTCSFVWDGGTPIPFTIPAGERWGATPNDGTTTSSPSSLWTETVATDTPRGAFIAALEALVNAELFTTPPSPADAAALTCAITFNDELFSCAPLAVYSWRNPVSPDVSPATFSVTFTGTDAAIVAAMRDLGFYPDLATAPSSATLTWVWSALTSRWNLQRAWNGGTVTDGGNIALPNVWVPYTYSYIMEERNTAVVAQTVSPYAAVRRTLRWSNDRMVTRFAVPYVYADRVFDARQKDTRWLSSYASSLLLCSTGAGFQAAALDSIDGFEQPYLTWGTYEQMIEAARNGSEIRAITEWGQPETGTGVRIQVRDYLLTDEATLGDPYSGATDDTDRGRLFTCGFEGLRL